MISKEVYNLIDEFLNMKLKDCTDVEKNIYSRMSRDKFIERLMTRRPLMFVGATDETKTRPNAENFVHWKEVGTEKKGEKGMKDYLTYDEMIVSGHIGLCTDVYMINPGGRLNKGAPKVQIEEGKKKFHKEIVFCGLVGARFENELMESSYLGFLKDRQKHFEMSKQHSRMTDLMRKFYKVPMLEVIPDNWNKFGFLATPLAKNLAAIHKDATIQRYVYVLRPYFDYANEKGKGNRHGAYVIVTGIGLGVWKAADEQESWIVEAVKSIIDGKPYEHIKVIDFSWIKEVDQLTKLRTCCGHEITVQFTKTDPAAKVSNEEHDKMLRVASFSWDSNAFPGNEYWANQLVNSGDPAAACSSTISETMNPLINPYLFIGKKVDYSNDEGKGEKFEENGRLLISKHPEVSAKPRKN